MSKRYLSAREVAEELDVSVQAVREWIRKGWLPAVRVGRRFRVTPEDVAAFVVPATERPVHWKRRPKPEPEPEDGSNGR